MVTYPNMTVAGTSVSNVPALLLTATFKIQYYYTSSSYKEIQVRRPDGSIYSTGRISTYDYEYSNKYIKTTVFATKADSYLMDVCKVKFGAGFETAPNNFQAGLHYIRGIIWNSSTSTLIKEDTGWVAYNMPAYDVAPETATIGGFKYRVRNYTCANAVLNPYLSVCVNGNGIFDPNSSGRIYFTRRIELMSSDGTIEMQEENSYANNGRCTGYAEMRDMTMSIDEAKHIRISVLHRQMGYIMASTGWVRNGIPSLKSISSDCTLQIDDDIYHYVDYSMGEVIEGVIEKTSGTNVTLNYTVSDTYAYAVNMTFIAVFHGDNDLIVDDYKTITIGKNQTFTTQAIAPTINTHNINSEFIVPAIPKSGYYKLYIYYDAGKLTYPYLPTNSIDTGQLLYIDTTGVPSLMSASVTCGTITVTY